MYFIINYNIRNVYFNYYYFIYRVYIYIYNFIFLQYISNTFTDFIPKYKKQENNFNLKEKLNPEIKINNQSKNINIKSNENPMFNIHLPKKYDQINIDDININTGFEQPKIDINKEREIKLNDNTNKNMQNQYNEIKKLKDELNKYKKENEELKLKLDISVKENNKLKEDLIKANKIISNIQNNNETNKLRDEINRLKDELNMKENELKNLNNKILNDAQKDVKVKYKDIKFVTFVSMDSTVQCGIKSLDKDKFNDVKEKHNKNYKNLSNAKNMFIANSKPILNFEKMNENNKKDGDIFQLDKLELNK